MPSDRKTAILFVCLGNICRSPLAEGVFRSVAAEQGRAAEFEVDSAGTGGWHVGSPPDPRSIAVAGDYGIDISSQRCRRISDGDFDRFDLVLGMDRDNIGDLLSQSSAANRTKVHLFCERAGCGPHEIPDPYYGGAGGFGDVYRMIREASESLIGQLS
jgi:protein-tyrosine phosphatase